MAGNIAGAIFGAIEGLGKGISNSANTARGIGSGEKQVTGENITNANGGENAATGSFRGYTEGKSDMAGITGGEKNNTNNQFGNNYEGKGKGEGEGKSSTGGIGIGGILKGITGKGGTSAGVSAGTSVCDSRLKKSKRLTKLNYRVK